MRISMEDAEKVNNSERGTFFKLKSNGSKAVVRFLHEGMYDIPIEVVHSISYKGRDRWVSCTRESIDSPISNCPLCSSNDADTKQISTRMYLELAVYETDKNGNPTGKYTTQVWERGKKFISKIQSLCNRYKPLCNYVFEIERLGEERSTDTTYEIYPIPAATKEEYPFELSPEPFDPVGRIVLNKSKQELEYYLDNGDFPPEESEEVVRRPAPAQEEKRADTSEYATPQRTAYRPEPEVNTQQTEQTDGMIRRRRF